MTRYRVLCATLLILLMMAAGCSTDEPTSGDPGPSGDDVGAGGDVNATQDVADDLDIADGAADVASDTGEPLEDASDTGDNAQGDVAADAETDTETTPDVEDDTGPDPVHDGNTCETAIEATAGGVWADQTTVGATDNYESWGAHDGCPNGRASGPDRVYRVSPDVATHYSVTVVPEGDFDPFIIVREDCSEEVCITGTVFNGPGETERVNFDLLGGQTAYIIVDGELGSSGGYTLTIELE